MARGECATRVGAVKAEPRRPVFVAARSVLRVAVGISGLAFPESIHGRQNPIYIDTRKSESSPLTSRGARSTYGHPSSTERQSPHKNGMQFESW